MRNVLIFPLNLPQVGMECDNMTSTNVCGLDSRNSVNLFTALGLKNKWASRISALQVAVDDEQILTSHICTKYTLGLVALEKADLDLHALKQQALSSLIALQSS